MLVLYEAKIDEPHVRLSSAANGAQSSLRRVGWPRIVVGVTAEHRSPHRTDEVPAAGGQIVEPRAVGDHGLYGVQGHPHGADGGQDRALELLDGVRALGLVGLGSPGCSGGVS